MKSFKKFITETNWLVPDYPEQILAKDDSGEWVTGDSPKPIEFPTLMSGERNKVEDVASILARAKQIIRKERGVKNEEV